MDGSVHALDEQSGSEWPHEFKVSAAAMPPLLRSVLVDNIKPDTVSVQSLLEVLGRASPHHLNMAFEAPVLHVPAALSAQACATLRAAVDSERTIARDSVDGGPEHQLNLSREALELLIGRDQCSRIWQLPKRFRMSTAVVPVAVPAATDTGDAASKARAEEAEAKGTAAVEAMVTSCVPRGGRLLVMDNGVYGQRIKTMAERSEIPVAIAASNWFSPLNLVAAREQLERCPDITQVAAVHHETTTGRLNAIDQLAALCREFKRPLLLDAVSSFGAETIDFNRWPIAAWRSTGSATATWS
jgi:hypothetical protein